MARSMQTTMRKQMLRMHWEAPMSQLLSIHPTQTSRRSSSKSSSNSWELRRTTLSKKS